MKFLNLLAIIASEQKLIIMNENKKILQMESCLFLWECNIDHDKEVISLRAEGDKLIVTLR